MVGMHIKFSNNPYLEVEGKTSIYFKVKKNKFILLKFRPTFVMFQNTVQYGTSIARQ